MYKRIIALASIFITLSLPLLGQTGNRDLFFDSVRNGNSAMVAQLLDEAASDINAKDKCGNTALHWAVVDGYLELAQILIERSADINAQNDDGDTPLLIACTPYRTNPGYWCCLSNELRYEIINVLLKCGADITVTNQWGTCSALYRAAASSKEIVELLINYGADINAREKDGSTPLMNAANHHNLETAQLLLDKKAVINPETHQTKSPTFGSPLHRVITSLMTDPQDSDRKILQLFITHGADVNARDAQGQTPLFTAVWWNNRIMIKFLLDHGADINAQDTAGRTPLHYIYGHAPFSLTFNYFNYADNRKDLLQLLINHGANVNVIDNSGDTPLHLALKMHDEEAVKLLVACGADVNAQKKEITLEGDTPLHLAKSKDIAQLLLDHGAHIDAQNCNGYTPLHLAVNHYPYYRNPEIIELLLEYGANMYIEDTYPWSSRHNTPLHDASGNIEIIQLFIKHGADVNKRNSNGNTLLHCSVKGYKRAEVVQLVIKHGAQVNAINNQGYTPLDLAAGIDDPGSTQFLTDMHQHVIQLLVKNGGLHGKRRKN